MTTRTVTTTTCDNKGCQKSHTEHEDRRGYVRAPFDPWMTLEVRGHYETPFGEDVKTRLDACSPECAIAILKRAVERLENAPKLGSMRVI